MRVLQPRSGRFVDEVGGEAADKIVRKVVRVKHRIGLRRPRRFWRPPRAGTRGDGALVGSEAIALTSRVRRLELGGRRISLGERSRRTPGRDGTELEYTNAGDKAL
jgi:hypothetical protein